MNANSRAHETVTAHPAPSNPFGVIVYHTPDNQPIDPGELTAFLNQVMPFATKLADEDNRRRGMVELR